MTIHSRFSSFRNSNAALASSVALGARIGNKRDSNRQRCYNWEFATLRPIQNKFATRQAAKGYARLCFKAALAKLKEKHGLTDEKVAQIRHHAKVAVTDERARYSNANHCGVYLANWAWTDVIIAHEVAHWADWWDHLLTASKRGTTAFDRRIQHEGHGPLWRGWFVLLLSTVRASPNGERFERSSLLASLADARLKVTLP